MAFYKCCPFLIKKSRWKSSRIQGQVRLVYISVGIPRIPKSVSISVEEVSIPLVWVEWPAKNRVLTGWVWVS